MSRAPPLPLLAACAALLAACAAQLDHHQLGPDNEQHKSHDVVRRSTSQFEPNVPAECLSTGFCEDVPDYPEDHVAQLIQNLGDARDSYYKVDELDAPEMEQRAGGEKMELCTSSRRVLIPRAAQDEHAKWFFIVNKKNLPSQRFMIQLCRNPDSPCSSDLAVFFTAYEGNCRQKFTDRILAALDRDGQLIQKKFPMPSCCSCMVRVTP